MTAPFNIDNADADPDEGPHKVGDLVRYTRPGSSLGRVGRVTRISEFDGDLTVSWVWPHHGGLTSWAPLFVPADDPDDPDALARPVRRLLAAIAMCAALQEGLNQRTHETIKEKK